MARELPIRTSNGGQPAAGILSLPTELISAICCLLCFHCRSGRVVDATSEAVAAAYEDQMAISALSRCSRGLRDVAQPILFHWYHDLEEEDYRRQQTYLERFVEAIIRNPNLAASVKALAFYQPALNPNHSNLSYTQARARHTYKVDSIFRLTAISLGPGHLERRVNALLPAEFVELRDLAITLSPALSQLCFHDIPIPAEDEAPDHNWTTWSYPLPGLTTLIFAGARTDSPSREATYHIREAAYLLRNAPNLHTLIAPDCGGGSRQGHLFHDNDHDSAAWDVGPLPALRTLSLNGIGMLTLARILRRCPALQDLEYYERPESELTWVVLHPARHLGHLQGTLRRLCYSVCFREYHAPTNWDDGDGRHGVDFYIGARYDAGPGMEPDGLGFAGFGVLEVLEVDQILLYGPVFAPSETIYPGNGICLRETTAENFLAKMPASLRRLRVGAVIYWPAIYRDLLALAEQHRARFPRLEAVAVEVYKTPPRYQGELLAGVFAAAGIAFSVARTRTCPKPVSRGLLPARPGRPEIVPIPVVYPDYSDCSESDYSEYPELHPPECPDWLKTVFGR